MPGHAVAIDKTVLDLTRLAHPGEGWSVLLGLVNVTPALAQRWLKNNFQNRPVKDDVVAGYARDAKLGQFLTTHQGIAFADDDKLIDGQHRLLAIIKSNTPCVLFVSFGWPVKIKGKTMTRKDIIDRGKPRSVPDQLKIEHGIKEGRLVAMVARTVASVCFGERVTSLSVGQTLDTYHAFKAGIDFVIARRSKTHGLRAAGVLAAFALAHEADAKKVQSLFEELNAGSRLKKDSALARLRDFLTSEEAILLQRSNDRGLAQMTLNALHLEMTGRDGVELHVSAAGADWFASKQADRVAKVKEMFKL